MPQSKPKPRKRSKPMPRKETIFFPVASGFTPRPSRRNKLAKNEFQRISVGPSDINPLRLKTPLLFKGGVIRQPPDGGGSPAALEATRLEPSENRSGSATAEPSSFPENIEMRTGLYRKSSLFDPGIKPVATTSISHVASGFTPRSRLYRQSSPSDPGIKPVATTPISPVASGFTPRTAAPQTQHG